MHRQEDLTGHLQTCDGEVVKFEAEGRIPFSRKRGYVDGQSSNCALKWKLNISFKDTLNFDHGKWDRVHKTFRKIVTIEL